MAEKIKFPCIQVAEGEINQRVITCGDPARAELISKFFDDPVCMAKNREFWTFNGTYKGVPVSVTSHGVGCGGAAIAFESMWRAGAKVIIRVGTCGGMQPGIDGVTEKMIPLSYPAVADGEVVAALSKSAKENGIEVNKGIILTQALFYPSFLESKVKLYAKAGVKAMENEVASLLVVASTHNVKAGAIICADAPAFELVDVEGYDPDPEVMKKAINDQIKIALDAIVNVDVD